MGGSSTPLNVNATTALNASTNDGFMTLAQYDGHHAARRLNAGAASIESDRHRRDHRGNSDSWARQPYRGRRCHVDDHRVQQRDRYGSADPIRTAIGALTATTNDGGVYISDSNGPGLIINSVLAKEGGTPVLDGSNQIVVFDQTASNPHAGPTTSRSPPRGTSCSLARSVSTTVAAPNAVTISSSGGRILQGQPGTDNVLAQSVNLMASGSIGVAGGAIGLTVESFSASTTNGGIFLAELIPGTATSVVAGGAGNNVSVTGSGATLGIGTITAPGTVTVQETGGALVSGTSMNITGQTVNLTGKSGIGTAAAPFTVTASNLSATAT